MSVTEEKYFNKVVLITKNANEYSLWIKEKYDTNTVNENGTKKLVQYKSKDKEKFIELFNDVVQDSLCKIEVTDCEVYIQNGAKNKSNFKNILDKFKSDENTILAIHFGEGNMEFSKDEANELDKCIKNGKLGAYLAYSFGNDIPKGINEIFNTIAQKDIKPEEITEQYNNLFNIFYKEGLKFEYSRWKNVVANIQSGISVWTLLDKLPERVKDEDVITKQEEILDFIKTYQLNDMLDFNIDADVMEELHKKLEELKKELNTKRNTL